jgi:alcohol dehydrogenase (cytochrome c)
VLRTAGTVVDVFAKGAPTMSFRGSDLGGRLGSLGARGGLGRRWARLALAAVSAAAAAIAPARAADEWPSYNRTLTSERFAGLAQIDKANVKRLKTLCVYDTGDTTSFQTGPLQVNGAIYFTTEHDTFSIDPETCRLNWRAHEDFAPGSLRVNRGAAYLDGRVFRGTSDGRVVAYDARTGQRLWQATIGDVNMAETIPAAPIAWKGLVFIGNAGGDLKGVKGRIYALDAATGKVVWEFYMVPKGPNAPAIAQDAPAADATWSNSSQIPITGGATWTSYTLDPASGLLYVPGGNPAPDFAPTLRGGANLFTGSVVALDARTGAYRRHFQVVPSDAHDYDVAAAPVVFTSRGGRRIVVAAPKDGYLYGYDLRTGRRRYRTAIAKIENQDVPISAERAIHVCPGHHGGALWNGPAYDPQSNLLYTGEVDWCSAIIAGSADAIAAESAGHAWPGLGFPDPGDKFGKDDPVSTWGGRLTAVNADSGALKWTFLAPFPLVGGVTPTAGGVVLFGDIGGTLYALDAATGAKLWSQPMDGALGGGVIAYDAGHGERIAVAVGMSSRNWPTPKSTARIAVMGLR